MKNAVQRCALFGGPALAVALLLFFDLDPERPQVTAAAAVALLMAIWWITEVIPLAVTSLLPVVLFPVLGIMNGKAVCSQYFNWVIFLFLGGFIVALAMQRWNLHKRIALFILLLFGARPRMTLLGFMVATAFLSMWISNTATTMMMVPIVLAIIMRMEEDLGAAEVRKYSIGIFVGVAYSASIGGVATLVGTPPNLSFTRIFENTFTHPDTPAISFAQWFGIAFPVAVVLLAGAWLLLSLLFVPRKGKMAIDREVFRREMRELGPMSFEEIVVLADFVLLALLWLFRKDITIGAFHIPGWSGLFPEPIPGYLHDGVVAVALAIPLFMVPARSSPGKHIMDWETAGKLPWGIVLLFGGGFALATGFVESGLSVWMGQQMKGLEGSPPFLIVSCICFMMTFLTELTSNTATTEMALPVLAQLAVAIKVNPLFLMIPATMSCSCAFMLPVATPPNAIIFGTKRLRVLDMVKAGIVLNIFGVVVIAALVFLLARAVLGMDLSLPEWAVNK
ncbi:MAG: SLC13 family permease [Planctomycetota bacterium]|jgi:sodium-dependent dicarboxylate transporter 2/3/5